MSGTRQCDFCGAAIEPGTGTMFVRTTGTTIHFCSSKCEKNADLGREARNLEWTTAGQRAGGAAGDAGEAETEPRDVDAGTETDADADADGAEADEAGADTTDEADEAGADTTDEADEAGADTTDETDEAGADTTDEAEDAADETADEDEVADA